MNVAQASCLLNSPSENEPLPLRSSGRLEAGATIPALRVAESTREKASPPARAVQAGCLRYVFACTAAISASSRCTFFSKPSWRKSSRLRVK
ncbi:MAG: hypothetical protein ONB44_16270 [candidate division KSB1 bacterium]|nr:hypothetical protein [candidate division KSB1 bacterium]MDZ7303689.1 hypothetical protein [candidate division KSB1 bacterium]